MLLRIGDLARAVGLSPDTIRHYERLGLLAHAGRTPGGFRQYTQQAVRRVRTIQAALEVGFSLRELASLFRARAAGRPPCREARRLAGTKLLELDAELARLVALRAELANVIQRWDEQLAHAQPGTAALLLESLADARAVPARRAEDSVSQGKRPKRMEASCPAQSNASGSRPSSARWQRSLRRAGQTRRPSTQEQADRRTRGR